MGVVSDVAEGSETPVPKIWEGWRVGFDRGPPSRTGNMFTQGRGPSDTSGQKWIKVE